MADTIVTIVETEVPTEVLAGVASLMGDGRGTTYWNYSGEVRGSHEDKNSSWDAVFENAKAIAAKAVFDSLCIRPGTAFVDMGIPTLNKKIQDHGNLCEYNGDATFTPGQWHEHWDRDAFGRQTHWQGWKQYKYSFPIKISVI
jgi:hypothetical protein